MTFLILCWIYANFHVPDNLRTQMTQHRAIPVLVKCLQTDPCDAVISALVEFARHGNKILLLSSPINFNF